MSAKINSADDEITFWESVARSKWGSYVAEIEKQTILLANSLIEKPTTALDTGCEGGRWSRLLVEFGWKMICTDINPDTLEICQKRIPTAKCILVNPSDTKLPCETESIGLILCIEVTNVIDSDWFIHEALRVLRPGGVLVADMTNSLSLRGISYHLMGLIDSNRRNHGYTPYKLNYSKWKKGFVQSGFDVVYEVGFCWFPFSRSSNSPLIPAFTKIERYLGLRHLTSLSPWVAFVAQKI